MVKGITAAYGTNQVFDVMLSIFRKYVCAKKKKRYRYLPTLLTPNGLVHSIDEAKTVLSDVDGNWLAQYELCPGKS